MKATAYNQREQCDWVAKRSIRPIESLGGLARNNGSVIGQVLHNREELYVYSKAI